MPESGFWNVAWETEAALENGPGSTPGLTDQDVVGRLSADLVLQRFIFGYRGYSDPSWLSIFVDHGLFRATPQLERLNDGSLRAWSWPALSYLRAVAKDNHETVAQILLEISTDNWWVITEAIGVAATLEGSLAVSPLLSLLKKWQSLNIQWARSETLYAALSRIAQSGSPPSLVEAMTRIFVRFVGSPTEQYELTSLVTSIQDGEIWGSQVGEVADAVEAAFLHTEQESPYGGLARLRTSESASDLLTQLWLDAVSNEHVRSGSFHSYRRGSRNLRPVRPDR